MKTAVGRAVRCVRAGLALAVVTAVLMGCAAQTAFRDGKSLAGEGKTREALGKFEEASRLEPSSAEYRIAYVQTRDRYAQALIDRADKASANGQYAEAETAYREALTVQAQQDRAVAGLRMIDQRRKWDGLLKEADQATERKDWDAARGKLKLVLMESPQHPGATRRLQTVEQQSRKPVAQPALANAYKLPITLEFKEATLRTVFDIISRTSKLNFIFDKEVKTDQRTSIYLRNSTVEAAVNWLLLTNQLEQRVLDANSVLVYPATPTKQKEYQPLSVKSFYLANAEAKNVANTLKTVLKSKDVVVDEKLNLVIMRDSVEAIRLAEKLVALHDVPEPEVMLEVEILEIKRGRLLDLGVRWPEQAALSLLPSGTGGTLTVDDIRNASIGKVGVAIGTTTITAKKTDSDANILANPRIRARNHEKAKILIGERVPNITSTATATGFVAESVNYVDVGLKLEVEPTVYLDNEVAIKVALEVSSIISQQQTKAGSLAYQLGTRTAQTSLRLKDGENQVLAGLINDEERRTANKVPGLGELPVVGRLFGGQADDSSKTEIVLSITPRIIRNVQRPDISNLEFESGTEGSLRSWSSASGSPADTEPDARKASAGAGAVPLENRSAPVGAGPDAGAPAAPAAVQTSGVDQASPTATPSPVPGIAQVQWAGPTQVAPNTIFSVDLVMQSERPVASVPLVIGFDPKVLRVVQVSEGEFLRADGSKTKFDLRGDDDTGQILMTLARDPAATGATASGVLARLNFRAVAPIQQTSLKVLSAAAMDPSGQAIPCPPPAPYVLTFKH